MRRGSPWHPCLSVPHALITPHEECERPGGKEWHAAHTYTQPDRSYHTPVCRHVIREFTRKTRAKSSAEFLKAGFYDKVTCCSQRRVAALAEPKLLQISRKCSSARFFRLRSVRPHRGDAPRRFPHGAASAPCGNAARSSGASVQPERKLQQVCGKTRSAQRVAQAAGGA